ncbi:MAG: hypothetical protein ABW176_05820 [Candidatus Thiodiazotropha endolucinida]
MEIVLGIVSAIIIFLLREALIHARQQKEIAARLFSYVTHWKYNIIFEDGIFKLSQVGIKWQDELTKLIRAGTNIKEAIKVDEKYEGIINDLFIKIEENSDNLTEELKQGFIKLESGDDLKNETLSILRSTKESILSGKTFITDQDAAKLGHHYSYVCVRLKLHLISLIDSAIFTLQAFDSNNLEYSKYKKHLEDILRVAILISKDIQLLSESLDRYTSSSVFTIAFSNLNYDL